MAGAINVTIGGSDNDDGRVFVGEDKTLTLTLKNYSNTDMSGWAVLFVVRPTVGSSTTTLSKTATISGSYNATPASNSQVATVTLTDTDLSITAKTYYHSWKRTDDGSETVLCEGKFIVEQATQT